MQKPMRVIVHLPETVDVPEDWSPADRARLLRVIEGAVLRAAATISYAQVEIARPGADLGAVSSAAAAAPRREEARERLDAARTREGPEYGVPGYQHGGAEVPLPLRSTTPEPAAIEPGGEGAKLSDPADVAARGEAPAAAVPPGPRDDQSTAGDSS